MNSWVLVLPSGHEGVPWTGTRGPRWLGASFPRCTSVLPLCTEFELLFLLLALCVPIPHFAALHPSSWRALLPSQFHPSES